ncbi:phosphoribosylanthranilate isomerase [Thermosyntropha lipolytica DSM 11003]|uniref:N-(5'-phosphoribosyl)anthranilate isomerase n=1 Tax=Thermosyntropha lipolytica DSM 11003 TaxID=1123382 RepID=A0A1M5M610_9FIRM|nr:phosphoribosylanthranilate isomerase [Thermosyntropha lipolytica]SHG72183.1 phosphoribosylanthranilate isomerase [Thermosyntropha lipolytica DSM 11003]
MTLVKICGIKTLKDALAALNYGAWAIGEVFAPSRRRIEVEDAARINRYLGDRIVKVGVFVDEKVEEVAYIARTCKLDLVQLHGNESPEYVEELHYPVIKAWRVEKRLCREDVRKFKVWAYLFDTAAYGLKGGSGRTFDWNLIRDFYGSRDIILAGGLNAANVGEAIKRVKPLAVDVSSGVEQAGEKDAAKIKLFMEKVKEADRYVS